MGKSPDFCITVSILAYHHRDSYSTSQPHRLKSKTGPYLSRSAKSNEVLIHVSLGLKFTVAPAQVGKLAASLMFSLGL